MVGDVIEQLFGVVLHKTTVWRILRKMGLTPQKPVLRAFRRDEAECRHWMKTEFPRIVRLAKRRQAIQLFADETGVHEDQAVGRTWGRRGTPPVVRVTGMRRRVNVISAISPRGRLWFRCFQGTLTAERFIAFLQALMEDTSKRIELILDRHPAHTAAKTRRFLHEQRRRLRVHWLPAYAPGLNPAEHVWSLVKGSFRSSPVAADEDFALAVHSEMADLKYHRRTVRSFFRHPAVRYIQDALGW